VGCVAMGSSQVWKVSPEHIGGPLLRLSLLTRTMPDPRASPPVHR
jgi:hypothetical protein